MGCNSFIHCKQCWLDEGWIERWEQLGYGISWEGVASLVKVAHRNGDRNITEREIDLAYHLKDKIESVLIDNSKSFIFQITFWVTCFYFPCIAA